MAPKNQDPRDQEKKKKRKKYFPFSNGLENELDVALTIERGGKY